MSLQNSKFVIGFLFLIIALYLNNKYIRVKSPVGKTVETKSGSIRGIQSLSRDGREYYEWLGIPYAKPPIGSLRFASPQALDEKWEGVREANAYGNQCAQVHLILRMVFGEEDCLYLNIAAPKVNPKGNSKLLPVMFYIHGGFFTTGSADQYSPTFFMDENVILVMPNYRLGVFGFLSTGDSTVRGNMGLKDQSLALKWVSENIANFGGDPEQITIFGHSSGSACVELHMLSPMSRGLMHRAITHSGSALNLWAMDTDAVGRGKRLASKLNCPTNSSVDMVKCLRNLDMYTVLEVHRDELIHSFLHTVPFRPTVEHIIDDDTFLHDHPINIIKAGEAERIPLLAGFNADEGLMFSTEIVNDQRRLKKQNKDLLKDNVVRNKVEDDLDFFSSVVLELNDTEKHFLGQILRFYFGKQKITLPEQYSSAIQLISDRWMTTGVCKAATLHAQWAPVQFFYYAKEGYSIFPILLMIKYKLPVPIELLLGFTSNWFDSAVLGNKPVHYGVCHSDELIMLFSGVVKGFNVPMNSIHYEFSKDLVKSLVSFALAAHVNDANFRGVKFPRVNPFGNLTVLEINDAPQIKMNPIEERTRFWESLGNK